MSQPLPMQQKEEKEDSQKEIGQSKNTVTTATNTFISQNVQIVPMSKLEAFYNPLMREKNIEIEKLKKTIKRDKKERYTYARC